MTKRKRPKKACCLPCARIRRMSKVAHYHRGDPTVRKLKKTRPRRSR